MKLLVIEDDDAMRSGLEGSLSFDGFEVQAFVTVEEIPPLDALDGIDGVLVDYQLPGENGLEFADRFHAARPAIPVILMTAHGSQDLDAKIAQRSYLHLLRKPFDYDDLLELVMRLTARSAPP